MSAIRRFRRFGAVAALTAGMFVLAPGVDGQQPKKGVPGKGGGGELTAKGQVKVGVHRFKLEVGKLYLVRVEANGFTPAVTIRPGFFMNTGESFIQGDTFLAYVLPTETREYRLTVAPSVEDDELDGQLFDYSITVTPIPMAPSPLLNEQSKLSANDPPYKNPGGNGDRGPHKAFTVNFKAGQVYIITVNSTNTQQLDPYLMVEGAGGKILAQDDDGGGDLNSRLFFKPKRGGEHRLIVTAVGKGSGGFNIKVVTTVAGAKGEPAPGGTVDPPEKE
ncbi:MAG TPA: hypothetical protein VH092_18490 [Urbifossiella sp.]|jgi:hypothetical protein|nr:hypothetical protein [Urbifossiella sp.]